MRRKAAADRADKVANARPTSTRAAGAGGSSGTMLSEFFFLSLGCSFWIFVGGRFFQSEREEGSNGRKMKRGGMNGLKRIGGGGDRWRWQGKGTRGLVLIALKRRMILD